MPPKKKHQNNKQQSPSNKQSAVDERFDAEMAAAIAASLETSPVPTDHDQPNEEVPVKKTMAELFKTTVGVEEPTTMADVEENVKTAIPIDPIIAASLEDNTLTDDGGFDESLKWLAGAKSTDLLAPNGGGKNFNSALYKDLYQFHKACGLRDEEKLHHSENAVPVKSSKDAPLKGDEAAAAANEAYSISCTCMDSPRCLCGFRSRHFPTTSVTPAPPTVVAFVKKHFLGGISCPRAATNSAVEVAIGDDLIDYSALIAGGNSATSALQQGTTEEDDNAAVEGALASLSSEFTNDKHSKGPLRYHPLIEASLRSGVADVKSQVTPPTLSAGPQFKVLTPFTPFSVASRGLRNMSCNCYFNAIVQALFHIPEARASIMLNSSSHRRELFGRLGGGGGKLTANTIVSSEHRKLAELQIGSLFAQILYSASPVIDTLSCIMNGMGIDPTIQQDAQEFLGLLLSTLSDLAPSAPASGPHQDQDNPPTGGDTAEVIDATIPEPLFDLKKVLQTSFVTQELYKRQCGNCHHISYRSDNTPFLTLSCDTKGNTLFLDHVLARAAANAQLAPPTKGKKKQAAKEDTAAAEREASPAPTPVAEPATKSAPQATGVLTRKARKALEAAEEEKQLFTLTETRRSPEVFDVDKVLKNVYSESTDEDEDAGSDEDGDEDVKFVTFANAKKLRDESIISSTTSRRLGSVAELDKDDEEAADVEAMVNKSSLQPKGPMKQKSKAGGGKQQGGGNNKNGAKPAPKGKKGGNVSFTPNKKARFSPSNNSNKQADESKKADTEVIVALEDAIFTLLAPEHIDGYRCDTCNSSVIANTAGAARPTDNYLSSRLLFKKLPTTLVFHWNRFNYDFATGNRKKNHCAVNFPEILDMDTISAAANSMFEEEPSVDGTAKPANSTTQSRSLYRLSGIVNHLGNSPHGGHYTYYGCVPVESEEDGAEDTEQIDTDQLIHKRSKTLYRWIKYDDNTVTDLPKRFSAHERLQSRDPYLLIYRKVDSEAVDEQAAARDVLEQVKAMRAFEEGHMSTAPAADPYTAEALWDPTRLPMVMDLYSSPTTKRVTTSPARVWPIFAPRDLLLPTLASNERILRRHSFYDSLKKEMVRQTRGWLQLVTTIAEYQKLAKKNDGAPNLNALFADDGSYHAVPEQWLADLGNMFFNWPSAPAAIIAKAVEADTKAREETIKVIEAAEAAAGKKKRRSTAQPWDEEECAVDILIDCVKGHLGRKHISHPSPSASKVCTNSASEPVAARNASALESVSWNFSRKVVADENFLPLRYGSVVGGKSDTSSSPSNGVPAKKSKTEAARPEVVAPYKGYNSLSLPSRFTDGLLCPHGKLLPFYYNRSALQGLGLVADGSNTPEDEEHRLEIQYTHRYKLLPTALVRAIQSWYEVNVLNLSPSPMGSQAVTVDEADDTAKDSVAFPSLPTASGATPSKKPAGPKANQLQLLPLPSASHTLSDAAASLCPLVLKEADFAVAQAEQVVLRVGDPSDGHRQHTTNNKTGNSRPNLVCITCASQALISLQKQQANKHLERLVKESAVLLPARVADPMYGAVTTHVDPHQSAPPTQPLPNARQPHAGKKRRDHDDEEHDTLGGTSTQPLHPDAANATSDTCRPEYHCYSLSQSAIGSVALLPAAFVEWFLAQPYDGSGPEAAYQYFIGTEPKSAAPTTEGSGAITAATAAKVTSVDDDEDGLGAFFAGLGDVDGLMGDKDNEEPKKGGKKAGKGKVASDKRPTPFNAELAALNFYTTAYGREYLSANKRPAGLLPSNLPTGITFPTSPSESASSVEVSKSAFNILLLSLCSSHGQIKVEAKMRAVPVAFVKYLLEVRGYECYHRAVQSAEEQQQSGEVTDNANKAAATSSSANVALTVSRLTDEELATSLTFEDGAPISKDQQTLRYFTQPPCCSKCQNEAVTANTLKVVVKAAKEEFFRRFTASVTGTSSQCFASVLEDSVSNGTVDLTAHGTQSYSRGYFGSNSTAGGVSVRTLVAEAKERSKSSPSSAKYRWLAELLSIYRLSGDINRTALKKDIAGYTKSHKKAWQKYHQALAEDGTAAAPTTTTPTSPAPSTDIYPALLGNTYFSVPTVWVAVLHMWMRSDSLELPLPIPKRDGTDDTEVTIGEPTNSEEDEVSFAERLRRRLRENWFNSWAYTTSFSQPASAQGGQPLHVFEADDLHPSKCLGSGQPAQKSSGGQEDADGTADGSNPPTATSSKTKPLGLDLSLLLKELYRSANNGADGQITDPLVAALLEAPMFLAMPPSGAGYATTIPPLTLFPLELLPVFIGKLDRLQIADKCAPTVLKASTIPTPASAKKLQSLLKYSGPPPAAEDASGVKRGGRQSGSRQEDIPIPIPASFGSSAMLFEAGILLGTALTNTMTQIADAKQKADNEKRPKQASAPVAPAAPASTTPAGQSKSQNGQRTQPALPTPNSAPAQPTPAQVPPQPLLPSLKMKIEAAAIIHECSAAMAATALAAAQLQASEQCSASVRQPFFELDTTPLMRLPTPHFAKLLFSAFEDPSVGAAIATPQQQPKKPLGSAAKVLASLPREVPITAKSLGLINLESSLAAPTATSQPPSAPALVTLTEVNANRVFNEDLFDLTFNAEARLTLTSALRQASSTYTNGTFFIAAKLKCRENNTNSNNQAGKGKPGGKKGGKGNKGAKAADADDTDVGFVDISNDAIVLSNKNISSSSTIDDLCTAISAALLEKAGYLVPSEDLLIFRSKGQMTAGIKEVVCQRDNANTNTDNANTDSKAPIPGTAISRFVDVAATSSDSASDIKNTLSMCAIDNYTTLFVALIHSVATKINAKGSNAADKGGKKGGGNRREEADAFGSTKLGGGGGGGARVSDEDGEDDDNARQPDSRGGDDADLAAALAASLAMEEGQKGGKNKSNAAPAVKECPVCTYHNSGSAKYCEMCESLLPA